MLALCGTVSATDDVNGGDPGGVGDVELPDAPEDETSNEPSEVLVDPIITYQLNFQEYPDDSGINPSFTVTDSEGNSIAYKHNPIAKQISFDYPGVTEGTTFKIKVSVPGYQVMEKEVQVGSNPLNPTDPNFYANLAFDMVATPNYRLGREVTKKADQLLNFATADDVLVITTAGVTMLNGTTTENTIEGILNGTNGKVTYGKGNLLILRKTPVDPVDVAFIVKRGNNLQAIFFKNGSINPAYQGTISQNMQPAQWNNLISKVGGENAFTYASLANAWNADAPNDLLREAAFHGHMCQGTISGYTISQALIKYYPPVQDTQNPGSPYDVTSYKVIGVPGDSDDDAIINLLNTTPGKGAYAGFDTTTTGVTDNMVGFVRWLDTTKTGDLIIMMFNRQLNRQQFETETGIKLGGDLEELKFNTWLLNKIKTNPESLVTFIRELKGLNEEQYYSLVGTASDIVRNNQVVVTKREAKGLDLAYIDSLNLQQATRNVPEPLQHDPLDMKQLGIDAANRALDIFFTEKGILLEKDNPNLVVQTSASYVYINGQPTDLSIDGIYEVLGSRLSRKTLLPMHVAPWKILYFCFTLRGTDGQTMDSIYIHYDPVAKQLVVGTGNNGKQINNIGPAALNDNAQLNNLKKNVFKEGGFFGNIQSIANAWRCNPRFDQLLTFLFHDHACPGVQPGFFISDMVFNQFPLGPDEEYFYMASSIYCKDDSIVYLMGVSPGQGTYMNQRLINEDVASDFVQGATDEGVLVIWDKKNNVGRAVIISFKWPELDNTGLITSEARRESSINYFINAYNNDPYARLINPFVVQSSDSKWITKEEFDMIKQGGGSEYNALDYVKSLPTRNLSDLIKVDDGNQNGNQQGGNQNGNQQGGSVPGTQTGDGATSPGASVGDIGPAVNAASQVQVTSQSGEPNVGDSGSAHEVSKKAPESEEEGINTLWIAVGAVLIGSLVALGFFKGTIMGMLK